MDKSLSVAAEAAAFRHVGAPSAEVVESAARAIGSLAAHPDLLAQHGISAEEFESAFPAAIESVRGRMSASNANRRQFIENLLRHLVDRGLATSVANPVYGEDTIYRVEVPDIGAVAIIQKGCPDGAHSSERWAVPDWAKETYLWWLCSSLSAHPGEHIAKGVNRLRRQFHSGKEGALSGVIFHNELCGSGIRPCPKADRSVLIQGQLVPPPCIYTMPSQERGARAWNWVGERVLLFPAVLLAGFDVLPPESQSFTGFIGFQSRPNDELRTNITARFGAGRSTTFRT